MLPRNPLHRRPLLMGAASLFAAGLISRVIGTTYRVLLARHAGEAALGLFQLTMPIYRLAAELATFGFPVAIAKRCAEALGNKDPQRAQDLRAAGLLFIITAAVVTGGGLFFTAGFWASVVLATPETADTLRALALLMIPTAISAGLRGVLQGHERLVPVAVANLVEAVSRAPLVLYLVILLSPQGPAVVAAGIAAGLIIPEIISTLLLFAATRAGASRQNTPQARPEHGTPPSSRRKHRRVTFQAWRHISLGRSLWQLAPPVAGSGLLNGTINLFSVSLIPRQLAATGLDPTDIARAYGQFSGMAMPLLWMPMVFIRPITQVVMPAVSNRLAKGGSKALAPLLKRAFMPSAAVAVVAATILLLFPETLGERLYGVSGLASLIQPLALAVPFAYLGHVAGNSLYGMGLTGTVMMNTLCGNLLRLGLIYGLVGLPEWGIHGAMWAAVADHILTGSLHMLALRRRIH